MLEVLRLSWPLTWPQMEDMSARATHWSMQRTTVSPGSLWRHKKRKALCLVIIRCIVSLIYICYSSTLYMHTTAIQPLMCLFALMSCMHQWISPFSHVFYTSDVLIGERFFLVHFVSQIIPAIMLIQRKKVGDILKMLRSIKSSKKKIEIAKFGDTWFSLHIDE